MTVHRPHARPRTSQGREATDREVIFPFDRAAEGARRLSSCCTGNLFDFAIMKTSVISEEFRARYLSRPGPRRRVRGARDRVRRLGRLPPPHQRSGARHRRELHPGDPRRRADRLAGLGRGGQHAAARRAAAARHHEPADARRRPPVGHVGQPLDPQRLARKRGRRRPRLAAHRRHDPHRPQHRAAATPWWTRRRSHAARPKPPPPIPPSNTPWEELFREKTGQLAEGGVLEFALKYRGTSKKVPRHNH